MVGLHRFGLNKTRRCNRAPVKVFDYGAADTIRLVPTFAKSNWFVAHPRSPRNRPTTAYYPLSWLGLGRSLAAEGNHDSAIDPYQHFLTL